MHMTKNRRRALVATVGATAGLVAPVLAATPAMAHETRVFTGYPNYNSSSDRGIVSDTHRTVYACRTSNHWVRTFYVTNSGFEGTVTDTTDNGSCANTTTPSGQTVVRYKTCTLNVANHCSEWRNT